MALSHEFGGLGVGDEGKWGKEDAGVQVVASFAIYVFITCSRGSLESLGYSFTLHHLRVPWFCLLFCLRVVFSGGSEKWREV